ncbi:MAG: porphobilinogen synthase [Candidatus Thermoplasmatota archaeon]|nr:porphobilinogen synthase [Candidatus Thermoplasmatota archaeon]MEC8626407.1 porphobilinogen synthase [Candidatus Thermoplasmatota archaeon]MEC9212104.1 porphobilinogen synthase [Candidatus Thermoplasmatota archaeon]
MNIRPRINRWTAARRELLFGDSMLASLVQPHFVVAGEGVDAPIEGMPGIHQQSVDVLLQTVKDDVAHGLRAVMLFGVVASEHKDAHASHAHDPSSHLHRAVLALKAAHGDDLVVMTDVCLCTATDHGHCGLVHEGEIVNDASVDVLVNIARSHAEAGADYVCASDMMDGRVSAIRTAFEEAGLTSTGILSYSVKYASSFYGPFRHAAQSSPEFGDRATHQMDIRSGYEEAVLEANLDETEGADILMVKPGLPYLDVVRKVADSVVRPVAVYNVSGEYAMVMNATQDEASRQRMVVEVLTAFKRAGAAVVVSYHAREAARKQWVN